MLCSLNHLNTNQIINYHGHMPRKIQNSTKFFEAYSTLFNGLNTRSLQDNTKMLGYCMRFIFRPNICDDSIRLVKYFIDKLLKITPQNDNNIQLANILYSTTLKKITSDDIIMGRVPAEIYKNLVDESIKLYLNNPINGKTDYRHIAGRMFYIKSMAGIISKRFGYFPKKLNALKWDDESQLDILGIMEKIFKDYEGISNNFNTSNGIIYKYVQKKEPNFDNYKKQFYENIKDLLNYTYIKILNLIKEPNKNKDIIRDKLDIAYRYFDIIPYTEPDMAKYMPFYKRLRKLEKELTDILKSNKKCAYTTNL